MPLLSISVKGSELQKDIVVKLERSYEFTELKLLHVYHNIDSAHLKAADATQQCQLFIKLGGLIENHKQIINYTGTYHANRVLQEQKNYSVDDYQLGDGTLQVNNAKSVTVVSNSNKSEAKIDINNLIPIGASKYNTQELISRDVFKELHKGSVLNFNGELHFGLHYMNASGDIVKMTATTGGIQATVGTAGGGAHSQHMSYMTLLFSYVE